MLLISNILSETWLPTRKPEESKLFPDYKMAVTDPVATASEMCTKVNNFVQNSGLYSVINQTPWSS